MPRSTLYICYFGVREPLVQTQVLPYLRELQKGGIEVSLLTFEPSVGTWETETRSDLKAEGIDWHRLRYHKRLSVLATAYDIFRGVFFVRSFINRKKPDVLHGRVHVPTLMAAVARRLTTHQPKLLFDIRGFFPEEYTDAGVWPENGWLYRSAKRVERWLLKKSDGFVVLTEKARSILFPESAASGFDKLGRPVEVIPCCMDTAKFLAVPPGTRERIRTELTIDDDRRVIVYVGAFGGWYMAEETAGFYGAARQRDPSTFAMILTQSDPRTITGLLNDQGFQEGDYIVRKVKPSDIPAYLDAADIAVSFIKPAYSKQASSPTKNAEYLAAGLPMIANSGVGDVDQLIEDNRVGVLIREFSAKAYQEALVQIDELRDVSERCRATASREFDLEKVGGARYRRLYERLLGDKRSSGE